MRVLKYIFVASLVLLVAACSSRNPDPLIKEEVQASAQEDYELLKESTANATMEIDLYQALAIAIKNNRELRIQVMDSALSQGQIDVVKFDMLPKLSANAGYKVLEKHPASTSVSMVDEGGIENSAANAIGNNPSYSVSQETPSYTTDIGFTWNALDFGLSYVRAGQQADRYLISKELERKAIHNLTKEVIYAYWKTLSADELLAQINPLMDRVNKALDDYEYIEELLISSPMDALLYQKELLDVAQILNTQRRALMDSRAQLANLLGLMPDQEFILVNTDNPLSELDMSLQEQEEAALFSRPELLEIRYQEKVTAVENNGGNATLNQDQANALNAALETPEEAGVADNNQIAVDGQNSYDAILDAVARRISVNKYDMLKEMVKQGTFLMDKPLMAKTLKNNVASEKIASFAGFKLKSFPTSKK